MRLYSKKLEGDALYTICKSDPLIAGKLIAELKEESFHTTSYRMAFSRIKNLVKSQSTIPSWETLLADPVLTDETRELLSISSYSICHPNKIDSFIERLQEYTKLRAVYAICNQTLELLAKDKIENIDSIVDNLHVEVTNAKIKHTNIGDELFRFGHKNNSVELVKSRLNPTRKTYFPTGFKAFDERNGGFNEGSLVLIGAPTGCGKTAVGTVQLPINMSKYAKVAIVPLEMTEGEMTDRLLANLASMPVNKFGRPADEGGFTKKETKHIQECYAKFVMSRKQLNTSLTIWSPTKDVDIMEVLYGLLPYDDDIYVIDYISLLKGVDGDEQWKQLGNVARAAKIFAKNFKKIVILLVQVNEQGLIKYSKAIAEHANNFWLWTLSEANRENHILDVFQPKARNQDPTPFQLYFDFSTMRIHDIEDDSIMDNVSDENKVKMTRNRDKLQKLANSIADEDEYLLELDG